MTRRQPRQTDARPSMAGGIAAALLLSAVAAAAAVASLWLGLTRTTVDPCRSLAWGAVPSADSLPAGWALASNRFFVDNATITLNGPVPSGGTTADAVFISVSCYGPDASTALARAHSGALATGARDWPVSNLGDSSFAVTNETTGTTIFVQRGDLVADVTAPTTVQTSVLEAILHAVDTAMAHATSGSLPAASPQIAIGTLPPSALVAPTAAPSSTPAPSASPLSHLAPDLEARLPASVDGTTLLIDSITGESALGTDATSQALKSSLADLGKTPGDIQISRARDPTDARPIRIYAFRVAGVGETDLVRAVVGSLLADSTASPTRSDVTIAGRSVTKLTYAQGPAEYVVPGTGGVVFDVETTDDTLARAALGLLD